MGLWVLLVASDFGFVGFVDVVALLVVDGFVGFTGGQLSQGLWVLLVPGSQWLVVAGFCGFCWVDGQVSVVAGFVGFVLQFFLLLEIREREERRLRRGVRERTECM